jgi:hypothetical protein
MTDKKTIGLTPEGEKMIQQLMDQGYFKDMIDAAKYAMSVAIRTGASPSRVEGANTIWNVGSFDSDGQIRQVFPILFPDYDAPYRATESLVDQGLCILGEKIGNGQFHPLAELNESSTTIT